MSNIPCGECDSTPGSVPGRQVVEQVGDGEPVGMADAMMMRGEWLKKLRLLEKADEAEREESAEKVGTDGSPKKGGGEDQIDTLPNGQKMLRYDSYLCHQRYYDDLKHIDIPFIDYGCICGADGSDGGRLIIEQRKTLGKGGIVSALECLYIIVYAMDPYLVTSLTTTFYLLPARDKCWDAAFILGQYMIANEKVWRNKTSTRLVELGSGTGLAGFMVAKACSAHVTVTDLPEILMLMTSNLELNFDVSQRARADDVSTSINDSHNDTFSGLFSQQQLCDIKRSRGVASAKVLRWGEELDYDEYDVVFGADVVASLYDPVALARTFHALSGKHSRVYLSYKNRLTEPHQKFEAELRSLFDTVERIRPASRNKNPNVWVLQAEGKKQTSS